VAELISTLDGAKYVERVAVDCPANVIKAKKAIKKALEVQKSGVGFSFVEVLCACPTNWGKTPVDALQFVRDEMMPYYPMGVKKDVTEEGK
jgi:2-oxoglutarate ferredoxin oxidoreductase subunit beta